MDQQELAHWEWLVSDDAQPWLQSAAEQDADVVAMARSLRRELSAEQARLIGEQISLRRRAREKFRLADALFFTRQGLEQSTDDAIAAWKASRFEEQAAIWDICCGIGGDLMALAARGAAIGVDRDAGALTLAAANVRVCGGNATTLTADAADVALPGDVLLHMDPDRRAAGRRVSRPQLADPPLEIVHRLAAQARGAAIKLAPAADAPLDWMERGEREWIERGGECRQQVAWLGSFAQHPGCCRATLLDSQGHCVAQVVGDQSERADCAAELRQFLFEPSPAVLAAELVDALACAHELQRIAPRSAYLTADQRVNHPALSAFEVLDELPFDGRRLKKYLRQHNLRVVEIKKRGADVDPAALQRTLRKIGDTPVTLLIAARANGVVAIIAQRCDGQQH